MKNVTFVLLLLASLIGPVRETAMAGDTPPLTQQQVEDIVQGYLLENPEVVIEAIQEFQRRRMVAEMLPKIEVYREYLETDETYPVLGNPNGSITLVEFFDYRCGFCKRNFPEVMKLLAANPDVRFIARQYPILDRAGQKPLSKRAAEAALAAHKQGLFAEFHSALMSLEAKLTEDGLYATAVEVGLNLTQLKEDMRDKLIDKTITNSITIGKDIGFTGTPSYFVGNDVAEGAVGFKRLQESIDRARADKAASR